MGTSRNWGLLSSLADIRPTTGIVCIGDSHMAGTAMVGTDGSGVVLTPSVSLNPALDEAWNGTAVAGVFAGNSAINVVTGSLDPLIIDGNQNAPGFLPMLMQALRSSGLFRRIRLANLGIGGSSTHDWSSEHARNYVQFTDYPHVNDTVTIGTRTYKFVASATNPNEVTIVSSTLANQAINLHNAINAEGTGWGAGTTINADVFSPAHPTNGYLALFAVAEGLAGNALPDLAVAGAGGHIALPFGASWAGAGPGLANAAIWTNGLALVPAGFGAVDVVLLMIGTNDAAREGWRGRNTQACYTSILTKIKAQWPTAKIVCVRPPAYTAQASFASTVLPAINAAIAAFSPVPTIADVYALGEGAGNVGLVSATSSPHMTDYGYSLCAQVCSSAILTALGMV
jgi:hypothetical protein